MSLRHRHVQYWHKRTIWRGAVINPSASSETSLRQIEILDRFYDNITTSADLGNARNNSEVTAETAAEASEGEDKAQEEG